MASRQDNLARVRLGGDGPGVISLTESLAAPRVDITEFYAPVGGGAPKTPSATPLGPKAASATPPSPKAAPPTPPGSKRASATPPGPKAAPLTPPGSKVTSATPPGPKAAPPTPPGSTRAPAASSSPKKAGGERAYYGNAAPEGLTVVVGGLERAAGGWAAYEAARRQARWAANPHDWTAQPLSYYQGRTFVGGQDALESLIGRQPGPLADAGRRLGAALGAFEAAARRRSPWAGLKRGGGAPIAVSTLAAADVAEAAAETEPRALRRLAEDVCELAGAYAEGPAELEALRAPELPALPPLPQGEVPALGGARPGASTAANEAVLRLEHGVLPRAHALEEYRARVADVFEAGAEILERAAVGGPRTREYGGPR
jgi:hypothetical protein